MSATRLHKLTALSFAVLYGVVGFTGNSLHYLLTDPSLLWFGSQTGESVGYYHVHGPDYHGHFHRHAHDTHHSHVAAVVNDRAAASHDEESYTSGDTSHKPHACPLLALVSTLKLSQAAYTAAFIVLEIPVAHSSQRDVICATDVTLNSCPRGPPCGSFA